MPGFSTPWAYQFEQEKLRNSVVRRLIDRSVPTRVTLDESDSLPFSTLGEPLIFRLLSEPLRAHHFRHHDEPSVGELFSGFGDAKTATALLDRLISTDLMFHLSQENRPESSLGGFDVA